MHSIWLVIVALSAFAVVYRLYGAFMAARVAVLDDGRATPANRLRDGVDYHPTSKLVLFGHHFAAIAGPGPLVGPVLAAQWGYLPGFLWIIVGAALAGAAHDFIILVASVRLDGIGLARVTRAMLGRFSGVVASISLLFTVVAILASVAIVVVNALSESSWGMFTIVITIFAALISGAWMYRVRPGRIAEASAIGVFIVLVGVVLGRPFAASAWGHLLLFDKPTLSIILPVYAAVASILPVWVLMCPRDYLSSYMKVGVMAVLGVGICLSNPTLVMPAVTPFVSGGGPVISGAVWPYLCIVIMCGAVSGFHALVSTGTTPKMIAKESHILPVAFGAMLVEGIVAVLALIAACSLQPGDYFAINVPQDKPAQVAAYRALVRDAAAGRRWDLAPVDLAELERGTGEKLAGRSGGAVTLAVGMAKVFTAAPGMRALMSYWYHFVIMFEALFILTLLETGTRVARFLVQESLPRAWLSAGTGRPNWAVNVVCSVVACFLWGYLLYTGNLNSLWTMLGIANQLLASIALAVSTTYLLRTAARRRYALTTGLPFLFVTATTLAAGFGRVAEWSATLPALRATQPAAVFNQQLLIAMALAMIVLACLITVDAIRVWIGLLLRPAGSQPRPAAAGGRAA